MSEYFTMAPPESRAYGTLALFALPVLAAVVLFLYFAHSMRSTRFELSPAGLTIGGTVYGRHLSWDQLRASEARVVDLRTDSPWQPTRRTNGIGLPGYRCGWFRLRGGGRGLLFVAGTDPAVVIPTTNGYTLLLSVREADDFLRALRSGR